MERTELSVGIGEVKVTHAPGYLTARGLGSCIGVSVYDPIRKIGGMAHIMLPDSKQFAQIDNPFKFADLGLAELFKLIRFNSSDKSRLEVKLAGGAKMFSFSGNAGMDIGNRNVETIRQILGGMGLRIRSEHLGGAAGRTVTLDTKTGILKVKVLGSGELEI